jgi:hypothetical protein
MSSQVSSLSPFSILRFNLKFFRYASQSDHIPCPKHQNFQQSFSFNTPDEWAHPLASVIAVCGLLFETIAFRVTVDAELPIESPVKEKEGEVRTRFPTF